MGRWLCLEALTQPTSSNYGLVSLTFCRLPPSPFYRVRSEQSRGEFDFSARGCCLIDVFFVPPGRISTMATHPLSCQCSPCLIFGLEICDLYDLATRPR